MRRIARLAAGRAGRPRRRDRRRPRLAHRRPGRDRCDGDRHRGRPAPRAGAARGRRAARACAWSRATPATSTGTPCSAAHDGWVLVANLPYNVATPLVARPARRRARHRAHAGDGAARGRRAPGRRAGHDAYGAPSREGGVWATADGRRQGARHGVPAAAEGGVGAGRASPAAPSRPCRRRRPRARSSPWSRAGFEQRRKMLRRSLAGLVDPAAFAAAGIRPEARAEELGIADWVAPRPGQPGRGSIGRCLTCRATGPDAVSSLAVVRGSGQAHARAADRRRPRRRLPPHRRRDGEPRPGRRRSPSPTGDGLDARRPGRRRHRRRRRQPRAPGAGGRRAHGPRCASTSGSRPAAGWAAARPTPPPCCAGPASPTWRRPPRSAPTCRSASSAGEPGSRASARSSSRCRSQDRTFTLVIPPLRLLDGRRLPGVGRPRRPPRRRAERPRAGGPRRRAPPGASGATGSGEATGQHADARRQRLRRGSSRAPSTGSRDALAPAIVPGDAHRPPHLKGGRPRRSRASDVRIGYLSRRWKRVRFSIFLCFFLRMRLRRFLISEPMAAGTLPVGAAAAPKRRREHGLARGTGIRTPKTRTKTSHVAGYITPEGPRDPSAPTVRQLLEQFP